MTAQTIANIANILRDNYGNTLVKAFTQYGPGNWLGVAEQSIIGMLQSKGRVYVGGKDAPQAGSGGRYAAQWSVHTATAAAQSYDLADNYPAATPEEYGDVAILNYKRYAISLEIDNMARVGAKGANVVGNVDAFAYEFESKLRSLMSKIETDLHADGTGNGGKNITGAKAFLSAGNTYAGLDQGAKVFWRSQVLAAGGAAISHALIRQMMRALFDVDGLSGRYLAVMNMTQWHRYLQLHENLMTYRPGDQAGVDIKPFITDGVNQIPVWILPQVPTSEIWFLKEENIELRFASHEAGPNDKGVQTQADQMQGLPIGIEPQILQRDVTALVIKAYPQLVYLNPRESGIISGLAT
jgi:hypothetical protein